MRVAPFCTVYSLRIRSRSIFPYHIHIVHILYIITLICGLCNKVSSVLAGKLCTAVRLSIEIITEYSYVGPIFLDGFSGERKILMDCYNNVLDCAHEHSCSSVAIPLISSGAYAYPKTEAYLIDTSTIRNWLYKNHSGMDISLVLYDSAVQTYL